MVDKPDRFDSHDGDPVALVCRVPAMGATNITMGSHVVVEDGEVAAIALGDVVADVLGPGMHVLNTRSAPLATRILGLPYGAGTRFDGALYFLRSEDAVELRWGSPQPVAFLDNMFGLAHVRAHGVATVRVRNARVFLTRWGQPASEGRLARVFSDLVVSRFTDALAERVDTLIDLERYRKELNRMVEERLRRDLELRGLELVRFEISAMTLPQEVMNTIESRAAVGSVRLLREFLRVEATRALICEAAQLDETEPEGEDEEPGEEMPTSESERSNRCRACHSMLTDECTYCAQCGTPIEDHRRCLLCASPNAIDASFCQSCGRNLNATQSCAGCRSESPPGARYCYSCGKPLETSAVVR